jgi:DNA primase
LKNDEPARLRRSLADPARVVALLELGKGAQRQSGGLLVRCPFPGHDDRGPSCSITSGADRTIRVRCFGCGASGDVLDLIAAVRGIDPERAFREVLVEAARLANVELDQPRANGHAGARRTPPIAESTALDVADFAELVAPLLHLGQLEASPAAADVCSYLDDRGLLEPARAAGWAALPPRHEQAPRARMLQGFFGAERCASSGLFRGAGFVWSDHRLLIPWRDATGRVATIQRRRLDAGEPKYVFATGRRPTAPYGIDGLASVGPETAIVFVEGAVDALALYALNRSRGLDRIVLGLPGVSGWRTEWASLARGRAAIVALDADDAGERKVPELVADLRSAGATSVRRELPRDAHDWADVWAAEQRRSRGAA